MNHEKYKDPTAEYPRNDILKSDKAEEIGRETWNQTRRYYSDCIY